MTLVKFRNSGNSGRSTGTDKSSSSMPSVFGDLFASPFPRLYDANDLVQDFFGEGSLLTSRNIGTTLPAVNIHETNNDLVIEMAAPGMKKNDFRIELRGNEIFISYQKQQENEKNEKNRQTSWRREFAFESFERTFTLPEIADGEKINASYQEGILKITIPKKEEARQKEPRQIAVS